MQAAIHPTYKVIRRDLEHYIIRIIRTQKKKTMKVRAHETNHNSMNIQYMMKTDWKQFYELKKKINKHNNQNLNRSYK